MRDETPAVLQDLPAACQLRYHLGLTTKRKRPFFKSPAASEAIEIVLPEGRT